MARKKKSTKRRGGRTPGQWTLLEKDDLSGFRKTQKLSRSALANTLGVSSTSIQNWETGRSVPLTRFQQQLVDLMKGGVPVTAARGRRGRGSNGANGAAPAGVASSETSLTATAEIVKGFLATSAGAKLSAEELVTLTVSLRAALS
jgi:DNA-binding transcriptional regulator YiaG